jgi:mannose-6-phosphate isomerase-like protein (cupin superfamily)
MNAETPAPQAIRPQEGTRLNILGDTLTCRLPGHCTAGAYSLFETTTPPGGGTPPHMHAREDETFIILEGTVEFVVAGERIRAEPGTTAFAPRNVPHCYRNVGDTPARMLLIASPPGIERFFEEIARDITTLPPDTTRLSRICAKHGITILPPA